MSRQEDYRGIAELVVKLQGQAEVFAKHNARYASLQFQKMLLLSCFSSSHNRKHLLVARFPFSFSLRCIVAV
jgi:hypothetical protein